MKINENKIKKTIKKIPAFILMLLFVFSNFISILPENIQNNKLAENFRVKEARASIFVAVSNYDNAASASAAAAKPAGTIDNDIMFAVVMRNTAAAPTVVPAGWALLGNHVNGVYQQRLYWKLAAGEGANYTWSWAAAAKTAITIAAYRGGFDTANPIDVVSNTEFIGAPNTTVRAASMNVSATNSSLFWFGTLYSTTVRAWTKPSIPTTDWVENYDGGATTSDFSRAIDSMVWTGSGATGNMDGTVVIGGTTTKHAFAVALNPIPINPDAVSFVNNTEGVILDGGRSSQQITITGTNFGAGPSDEINNAVKIGAYAIPNGNVVSWNNTTIIFTIPSAAATYGGAGADGLTVRANGLDDTTPLDFYIYPNITSLSANNEQIGNNIIVNGDHFGVLAGSAIINTKSAAVVGAWNENNLTVRIPGQEGAANIIGKIQITRSDIKTSNLFPSDPVNFTILAPSISGSNPVSATTGQSSVPIEFSGFGIDTDTGTDPILKLVKAGEDDIIGAGYSTVTAYQTASAAFDLSGAAIGVWDLAIINMDGQSGVCGGCFTVNPLSAPVVTGINPDFGLNSGVRNITSITGGNFQNGAAAKLTKTFQTDIFPSTAFTFTNANTLSNGVFDLSSKALGYWNVVITNPDLQTGSYGNEIDTGFEIRSAIPSNPTNLSQSKTELGPSISEGGGVGGQVAIYLRMDMEGGSADNYTPEVEVKPYSTPLDGLSNIYAGTAVYYDPAGGIPAKGFVVFSGTDGELYHWRVRVQNSSGTSGWTSFGTIPGPNDTDFYLDNTPPSIDTLCANTVTNVSDLGATIQWNTSDAASGAQNPPGSGTYATAQVQYIKTDNYVDWIAAPGATTIENVWENSPHQVSLSSLSPGTDYTFRMRSKDGADNEAVSANCAFTTEGARPIKTIEFFILQEANKNTGTRIKKNFSLIIPENTGIANSIQPKSAYIEISGISSATGNQTINSGLLRGDQVGEVGPAGNNYFLDSTGTTTQFTILFDALIPGSDNEDMLNITSGGNYEYTLFLNGDGITDVSLFSAKLVLTYNYKP